MKKPVEPKPEDCCNSGCNPCIYDVYEKQLKLYESTKRNSETSRSVKNAISELEYTQFYVASNKDLRNSHHLLIFKKLETTCEELLQTVVFWNPGDHFLFKFISKEMKCTRAYTPLKNLIIKQGEENNGFSVIVKRYADGLVSNYLCNLKIGDITLWRGPYGQFNHIPNRFSMIIMIAQGTGIAPFHSIINQILDNEEDMTKIHLYYCCKNPNSIIIRDELYSYMSYWNFKYDIFLNDGINERVKYKEPLHFQRFNLNCLDKQNIRNSVQFLICGSKKFVVTYKQSLIDLGSNDRNIITF